jgi:hypothetical protein
MQLISLFSKGFADLVSEDGGRGEQAGFDEQTGFLDIAEGELGVT